MTDLQKIERLLVRAGFGLHWDMAMYKSKLIVPVVGMHRSGTSLTAGTLHKSGIHMGCDRTFYPPSNKQNPRGFFENVRFRRINDSILERNTYTVKSWSTDFPETLNPGARALLKMHMLITYYALTQQCWGFKDPRTCLTLNLWLTAIDRLGLLSRVKVVFVERDLNEIKESLMTRNSLSESVASTIISEYIRQAKDTLSHWNVPVYTLSIDAVRIDPDKEMCALCTFLGLRLSPHFRSFYNEDLLHSTTKRERNNNR